MSKKLPAGAVQLQILLVRNPRVTFPMTSTARKCTGSRRMMSMLRKVTLI